MAKVEIEFIFNTNKIVIQAKSDDTMKIICQKFLEKTNLEQKNIFYSYNGTIGINEDLRFEKFANYNDRLRNKMSVLVFENEVKKITDIKRSKSIICPECKESIKMDIIDYKIKLYDCKNGHKKENILLDEFEETQNLKIVCDECKVDNINISSNNIIFRCNNCNKKLCLECKSKHDKTHKIIDYNNKYYICEKHNETYISYCEECKVNLCNLCDDHENHKRIQFFDLLPKKGDLINKVEGLKEIYFYLI